MAPQEPGKRLQPERWQIEQTLASLESSEVNWFRSMWGRELEW